MWCTRSQARMHFNPRSPRGGATKLCRTVYAAVPISIHAPHEGERRCGSSQARRRGAISIHAPHEGERLSAQRYLGHANAFQSTLPTRGSDVQLPRRAVFYCISIHAPHEGERHLLTAPWDSPKRISIHAPHEGERPDADMLLAMYTFISIHAPHEGERHQRRDGKHRRQRISIHAPHEGERPVQARHNDRIQRFQSTLPTRGSDTLAEVFGIYM